MGKPALGKGMKDLLNKKIVLGEQEGHSDSISPEDELRISIERYRAQEFDVTLLEQLQKQPPEEIPGGIEEYRGSVKKLISAQTIIRSLDGYGYNEELDRIMEKIKDPAMAGQVLAQAEELRDRAMTEHNLRSDKKDTPRFKLSEALKVKSEKLNGHETVEPGEVAIDLSSLDDMLANLNEIGEAFMPGAEEEPDPVLEKVRSWEEEGYFVDRILKLLEEDRDAAQEEMKSFEQGISEMRLLKERYRKMDLSGSPKEMESISMKFQYPHMASEIRNELDAIDRRIDEALREASEEETREEAPILPEGEEAREDGPEAPGVPMEEAGDSAGKKQLPEEQPPPEESPPPAVPEPDHHKVQHPFPDLNNEQLLDRAKELYRDGDLDTSLKCFEEILRRDPGNSKARFMMRRLSTRQ
ncbi:MAG: hypothetical protein JXA22_03865 [Candidatus Thermoplasmatota archaeon]|nr:hypothetical protein [Candidatus Thermoplasmatota archaeon]